MHGHTITVTLRDEDEESEAEHELPAKKEVCHDCNGHGMVLNESMRYHAYTSEEFMEEFDEEDREQYFTRGGIYDVQCLTCKGANVVSVIDREACERDVELKTILKEWDKQEEEDAAEEASYQAICRMERMMGC